ncbi:MAG: DUF1800 domain-containing protein, partial [Bacteroidota bacterium]
MKHSAKVKHLYARAGFGITPKELQKLTKKSIPELVNKLVINQEGDIANLIDFGQVLAGKRRSEMTDAERKEFRRKNLMGLQNIRKEWIEKMAFSPYPFAQKMTLFWHGHFACHTIFSGLAQRYVSAIHKNCIGNFKTLVLAISKSPAMIQYLNNQQNKKNSPNENFARELLELFTIGRGHYTEEDIKEAARAFTGWSSNLKGEYVFRPFIHDYGKKTFMGKTGKFGGEDIVNIILNQKQTAYFISEKVFKFFVHDQVNRSQVEELADVFYQNKFDIKKLMKHLLNADWFYDPAYVGNQIKSPIVLIATMMKQLNLRFNDPKSVDYIQRSLGQILIKPPNVAGWPGGRAWIDNATLMLRLNLAHFLFNQSEIDLNVKTAAEALTNREKISKLKASINLGQIKKLMKDESKSKWPQILADYLLNQKIDISKKLINAN